ncbi:hypothetical protein [Isobaculum melis]|uniref:Uncharacterized protein n=1 Tax=Isobaculum melis TaxID=142588 RepID=A0A1H9PN91_9LACT|nr:hypothetical protein [Isobaculum melis]SER49560.1 hypothetical protein SAMN04488559_10127 [Isobaculum melis]
MQDLLERTKKNLKSFDYFKKNVTFSSALHNTAMGAFSIGGIILFYNLASTFQTLTKNDIPFDYFWDLFFSDESTNVIFLWATYLAFILIPIGIILFIVAKIRRESDIKKLHDDVMQNEKIICSKLYHVGFFYFRFRYEDLAQQEHMETKFEELRKTLEDSDDKKWRGVLKAKKIDTFKNKLIKTIRDELNISPNEIDAFANSITKKATTHNQEDYLFEIIDSKNKRYHITVV